MVTKTHNNCLNPNTIEVDVVTKVSEMYTFTNSTAQFIMLEDFNRYCKSDMHKVSARKIGSISEVK